MNTQLPTTNPSSFNPQFGNSNFSTQNFQQSSQSYSNSPHAASFLNNKMDPTIMASRESPEDAKRRFEIECEFVQALCNPNYLNYLAQRGYFKETYFVNYLKYLLYFKRPEYAKTLKFPQCLFFLEVLQNVEFREAIASSANARFIEDQQLLQWHYYIRKRQRLQQFSKVQQFSDITPSNNQNENVKTN